MDATNTAMVQGGAGVPGIAILPDHTLGRILELAGGKREVALVCRRWWRVYWSELWASFDGVYDWRTWMRCQPGNELQTRLLAVVQRIAPQVGSFTLYNAEPVSTSPAELLRCLRPQRVTALRLTTEGRRRHDAGDPGVMLQRLPSLPTDAVRAAGRLRRLTSLSLDSWHLPHCTSEVLARLTRLQELRLRARQLPPRCLEAVTQLAELRALELSSTMELGPVAQLSCLTRLTSLRLHQHNQAGAALEPPPVASLPHLQSYSFCNERGPLLMPGGALMDVSFSSTGDGGGAQLVFSSSWLTPRTASLPALLDGLLPAGTELRQLKVTRLMLEPGAAATVQRCAQLSTLRSLELNCLVCDTDGEEAVVLRGLLAQATGLRRLALTNFFSLDGADAEVACLANYTGLEALDLSCNESLTTLLQGPLLETVRSLSLGATDLRALPHMAPPLERLVLAGCSNLHLPGSSCMLLGAMPSLTYLDIRGVEVWPGDLVSLARECPSLRIRADTVADAWDPDVAGFDQL